MGHGISFRRYLRQTISAVGPHGANRSSYIHRTPPPGARIICYHGIDEAPTNEYAVAVSDFRGQMRYLNDNYRIVSVEQIIEACQNNDEHLRDLAAVTFDDGYEDFYSCAYPVLHDLGIPATVFLPTGLIDRAAECRNPLPQQHFLTWEQVRELRGHGVYFGAHSVSHRSLTSLSLQQIRFELEHSKRRIEEELQGAVTGFSYPYGTFRDTDPKIGRLIAQAGYAWAVTAISGSNRAGADPFTLRRTVVTGDDGPRGFVRAAQGSLDGWVMIQRLGDLQDRHRRGDVLRDWEEIPG